MKNSNERKKPEEVTTGGIAGQTTLSQEAEIIPFERRSTAEAQANRSLLHKNEVEELLSRWKTIQTNFVDEPRKAVEEADKLVASAIKRIAESFFNQRADLEKRWTQGEEVSTEDLRISLQHYRAFFSRLLSI